ncbi:TPA: P-type conjugative transfer protein TrbL, partial [Legionella pneumophila]
AGSVLAQSGGGLSALNAAFKAASQSTNSGDTNALSGMDKSSKTGGLAEAMGSAAKFAGSFGSHLASGTMDVAREKANSIKEAVAEKIADTTGGKIAEAIQNKVDTSVCESQESNAQNILSMGTPAGSLSSGFETSDEVSQFVNQKASGESQ